MALNLIGEVFDRAADEQASALTTQRVFLVQATAKESGVLVLGASGLPAINDVHPDNANIYCQKRSANKKNDTEDVWQVACSFSPNTESFTTSPGEKKPWDLPPFGISFSSIAYSKVLKEAYQTGDTRGNPTKAVLNSAKDPFDPPAEMEVFNLAIKFSYNILFFNVSMIRDFIGTVNSVNYSVIDISVPAQKGKINALSAQKLDVKDSDGNYDYSYYQIDVEIEISERDYISRLLDIGFYRLDGVEHKEIKLSDIDSTIPVDSDKNHAVTEPQKLNGSGALGTTPFYIPFYDKFITSWNPLSLPKTMQG
jgi:hypothetical protein